MANREALRELQVRLASRLQAARDEGLSVSSWLAVESAGNYYLLPLGHAGEIFPWTVVQHVPYTQKWFMGVANLRGGLTGVVDLAGLLGDAPVRTEQALSESSLLAFFGTTYIDSDGKRWQELNLQALSQHTAFLSISA